MQGMNWTGTRYSPIAMGIGSHFVHIVQLRESSGTISLSAAEAVPIGQGDDKIKAVVSAVKPILAGGGFRGRRAAICLKGNDIFIQHQRMSLEGKTNIEDRIREELRRDVSFDVDRAEVRYITTGRVYERSELLEELILMIANREVADRDLAILDALKLTAVMIGVEPLGQMRSLLQFPPPGFSTEDITAFMDIAASKTELLVIRNGGLAFTRSLPLGGEKFTQAIAEKLGIDSESAARLKNAMSDDEAVNETLSSAALAAVRPVLEEICSEILSCFRYFSSISNRESVTRLIVAGREIGGLANPAFMQALIHVPVIPWKPEILKGVGDGRVKDGLDFGFTPVIGVALEALQDSAQRVDFMPREVIERSRKKTSLMLRIASLTLLILVMFILQLITHQRKEKLSVMRTYVQNQINVIDEKTVRKEFLEEKIKDLEEKRTLLLHVRPQVRASRILAEIARAAGEGITLNQFKLEKVIQMKGRERSEKKGEGQKRRIISYLIHIEGLANNTDDVNAFVENLAATKAFSSIHDKGFADEVMRELNLKSFSLTLMVGGGAVNEVF